jgi:hypothetical protein
MTCLEECTVARVYHMTWIPSRRGWMKEYKGKKYVISCRQLSVPETKDESYQAANAWWFAKKVEVDDAARPQLRSLLPLEDLAASILGKQGPLDEQDANTLLGLDAGLKADDSQEVEVFIKIDKDGNATIWPTSLGPQPKIEDKLATSVDAMGKPPPDWRPRRLSEYPPDRTE